MVPRIVGFLLAAAMGCAAAPLPRGCAGSVSLGTFRLWVRPATTGLALPLRTVSAVPAGALLIWEPVRLPPDDVDSAEVTAVVVPLDDEEFSLLEPRKAATRAEWTLPQVPSVVALIVGPHGFSQEKVRALVTKNRDLLRQLAAYAEQTSEVENLVQRLADSESSNQGTDAALRGFSSRYGVDLPRLDTRASTDQQAAVLLRAVMPAAATIDPLAPRSARVQQSAGLAASVAGLFFGGSTVGLAAGGAALFQGLRSALFPATEFRSAFAQADLADSMALCTHAAQSKGATQVAYLWAYHLPRSAVPKLQLDEPRHFPLGARSSLPLSSGKSKSVKDLDRIRDWRLRPVAGGLSVPVSVSFNSTANTAQLDLSNVKAAAGEYELAGNWDWSELTADHNLFLHPYADLKGVAFAPGTHDRLVRGAGPVAVELVGADFQFIDRISVKKLEKRAGNAQDVRFSLPSGARLGPQQSLELDLDTAAEGTFQLSLLQADGQSRELTYSVLPANPKLEGLPVRANLGEPRQTIRLSGSGLDRVMSISTPAGTLSGGGSATQWAGELCLQEGLEKGARFPLELQVRGLEAPLSLAGALEIAAARPKIVAVRSAIPAEAGPALQSGELPAGLPVGLSLRVENLPLDQARPQLELSCAGVAGEPQVVRLAGDAPAGAASLARAGAQALFLSFDPARAGAPGCRLTAVVRTQTEGASDPFPLGRVVRLPKVVSLTLTSEKVGPAEYAAVIRGRDLDVIEKAGWDAAHAIAVESIPTPLAGEAGSETLRLRLSWPAPEPHAPLYIWLHGESEPRLSGATL